MAVLVVFCFDLFYVCVGVCCLCLLCFALLSGLLCALFCSVVLWFERVACACCIPLCVCPVSCVLSLLFWFVLFLFVVVSCLCRAVVCCVVPFSGLFFLLSC